VKLRPDILEKLGRFCSYQERCIEDVKAKLIKLGLGASSIEGYVEYLLEIDVLNEERFARTYTKSKFNIKSWGRIKIRHALRLKKIPSELIELAWNEEISEDDYLARIGELAHKKRRSTKSTNEYKNKAAIIRYLQQKGFEYDLILDHLNTN